MPSCPRSSSSGSHRSDSSCFRTKRTPRSATRWLRCVTPRGSHRRSSRVPSPRVERALLAVAAGCGPAILPESVTDRYATPGVRFVALADAMVSVRTVVLTQPDNGNLATAAFLRDLERATTPRAVEPSRRVVSLSARSGGPDDRADANLIARARRLEPHPAARAEASEGAARASRRTAMSDRRHLGVA